jgi:predicted nucleotidyltransferase
MSIAPTTTDHLPDFCRKYHIRRLSLFGSAARGEMHGSSDVDLLVEFEPEQTPGLFTIARMVNELSPLYGRQVDLRTAGDLHHSFRDRVVREALLLYEAD